jgi:hypothetical protein
MSGVAAMVVDLVERTLSNFPGLKKNLKQNTFHEPFPQPQVS